MNVIQEIHMLTYLRKHVSRTNRLGAPLIVCLILVGAAQRASATTINFESLPSLPTQPNNFAAAGAMQTYSSAGLFSVTGGVVLGNPTFLASFAAHGSAPNAYGTAD